MCFVWVDKRIDDYALIVYIICSDGMFMIININAYKIVTEKIEIN